MKYLEKIFPATKFYVTILFIICLFIFNDLYINTLLFVGLSIITITNGSSLKVFPALFKSFFSLIILIFILQGLFFTGAEYDIHFYFINLKSEGLFYAANLSIIMVNIGMSILLLFDTTTIDNLAVSLEQHGLSKQLSYILISTFMIIPELKEKSNKILIAQQSRGLNIDGNIVERIFAFVPVIGTLLLSSLIATEEKALTLTVRGYSLEGKKTHLHPVIETKKDKLILFGACLLFITVSIWRLYTWLI